MKMHKVAPIHIYEVVLAVVDEEGYYQECYESDYVITQEDFGELTCEEIVKLADCRTPGPGRYCYQVYEARTANIILGKNKLPDDVDDVDTATGCNGSPIYEHYFVID